MSTKDPSLIDRLLPAARTRRAPARSLGVRSSLRSRSRREDLDGKHGVNVVVQSLEEELGEQAKILAIYRVLAAVYLKNAQTPVAVDLVTVSQLALAHVTFKRV